MSPRRPRSPDSLHRSDRITAILESLSAGGVVQVAQLAERFGVSPSTLRRDLALLEQQRLLARTHGGALARDVTYELPVRYRDGHQRDEKRAIALAAAQRVPTGPVAIGLTGGTTTSEVARAIPDRPRLTVVTNALNIAMELAMRPRIKVIVTGGVARPQSYELVGPFAEQSLARVNLGLALVGVDGVAADGGLTTHDEIEAHTNQEMIRRAQRVIVVADGTKVGRVLLAHIAPLSDVDELITTDTADPVALAAIRHAGVAVHVATVRPLPALRRPADSRATDGRGSDGRGEDGRGEDGRGEDGRGDGGRSTD